MKTFDLNLLEATGETHIAGVVCFVGEDRSGSFAILANHLRMITTLTLGMARYQSVDGQWHHLAIAGGVLSFRDNGLTIATRHALQAEGYRHLAGRVATELLREEEALATMRSTLKQMEQGLLQRLVRSDGRGGGL